MALGLLLVPVLAAPLSAEPAALPFASWGFVAAAMVVLELMVGVPLVLLGIGLYKLTAARADLIVQPHYGAARRAG